jgi:hypothetical protein
VSRGFELGHAALVGHKDKVSRAGLKGTLRTGKSDFTVVTTFTLHLTTVLATTLLKTQKAIDPRELGEN